MPLSSQLLLSHLLIFLMTLGRGTTVVVRVQLLSRPPYSTVARTGWKRIRRLPHHVVYNLDGLALPAPDWMGTEQDHHRHLRS